MYNVKKDVPMKKCVLKNLQFVKCILMKNSILKMTLKCNYF